MIWAKILFLSWCKSGVDPLFFARLPFVYGRAVASTLTVILQARVCGAEQQLPQKSPFLRHVRHVAQDRSHFTVLQREAGAAPRGGSAVCVTDVPTSLAYARGAFSPVVSGQ